MVDMIILDSDDAEFMEGIAWIDQQARKQGVSFYALLLDIMLRHMAEKKAKQWLASK